MQLIDATALFEPMRKSEGNKRRRIGEDRIRRIVEIYAAFEETKESRIFHHREFGYRRIRVLRPLRRKIVISPEGLAALEDETAWGKLDAAMQDAWRGRLTALMGETHPWDWIDGWAKSEAKRDAGLGKVTAALVKAFQKGFGVRDPELEPVRDRRGDIVPDDELTDFENVSLDRGVQDYLAEEVLPHAPDAWIDEDHRDDYDGQVGLVGYEINFNRYFYEYQPPRDLSEIDAELKAVEAEIAAMLAEVTE